MKKSELLQILIKKYSRNKWKKVIDAIFPKRDFFASEEHVELTTQTQLNLANKIIRFGNIELDDGNTIAIYEVELKENSKSISKSRVSLRNLITSEIIPGFVDGALITYFQNDQEDWRFSFYSKTLYWDEKGSEIKKETHPKRYTYVLGPTETCVTPLDRFWYLYEKRTKTIKDVLEAFSVEKVSNEFFAKYKKHYQAFVDELINMDNHNARIVFENDDKLIRDFVKKMLGRLVFLQFLQKKGWLDVPLDEDYGSGSKSFMYDFFKVNNNDDFYSKCLVPLFFNTLNNSDQEIFNLTGNKFPYLNGGLFERDEIEKKEKADNLSIKGNLFENLFDFFREYNFTIDENTPDDLDVGIDPEMLGHIFENLLEENHMKGAYYTPKMIVQYMCQEVLIQYLELHLGKNQAIQNFIRYKDRGEEKSKTNFIHNNASKIANLLDNVKICDPAIGSGAFPMGLLQEIFQAKLTLDWTLIDKKFEVKRKIIQHSIYGVDKDRGAVDIARLRFWLSLIVDEEVEPGLKPQPLPNLDYKIMQGDSLFESFKGIPLVYDPKIEDATPERNLFGEVKEPQMSIFYGNQKNLVNLENDFYDPKNNHRKEVIRKQINELIAQTIKSSIENEIREKKDKLNQHLEKASSEVYKKKVQYKKELKSEIEDLILAQKEIKEYLKKDEKPYFLWHLHFKEVFDKGGFDIVIGNPPYIRQELIKDIKPYLKKEYEVFNSTSDIYTYFFELGLKILKKDRAVFSFICSKQYTRGRFGQNLRSYLLNKSFISKYINFDEVKVFGATVDTSIIFLQHTKDIINNFDYCDVGNDIQKNTILHEYVNNKKIIYNKKYLKADYWSFTNPNEIQIIQKIEEQKKLLDYGYKINLGIKTGCNEAFYIDEDKKNKLDFSNSKVDQIIVKLVRGRNIKKYTINDSKTWLINSHNGYKTIPRIDVKKDHPVIYKHLLNYKNKLIARNDQGNHWSNLRNCTYIDEFIKPKIIWLTLTDSPNFAYDEEGYFINNSAYFFTGPNLKYVLSVLNSKTVHWYFNQIATRSGQGTNRWEKTYVEQIPIPDISSELKLLFNILVDYVTYIKKQEKALNLYTPNNHMAVNYEELIDACVYELYFPDHMKEKEIDVLQFVKPILIPIDHLDENSDKNKINAIINSVYEKFKSTDSKIRKRIQQFPVKSPDIISIIQKSL